MDGRLTIAAVTANRQQRLAVSMRSRNAVVPQALLTWLDRHRAAPNDSLAAASLVTPRGTVYIYIKPEALISRDLFLSQYGDRLRVAPLERCLTARCILLAFSFFFKFNYRETEGIKELSCNSDRIPNLFNYVTLFVCSRQSRQLYS